MRTVRQAVVAVFLAAIAPSAVAAGVVAASATYELESWGIYSDSPITRAASSTVFICQVDGEVMSDGAVGSASYEVTPVFSVAGTGAASVYDWALY